MAGNAAEEGLIGQIGNPSHLDTGRIVVPAALVCGYLSGYLLWLLVPAVTFLTALLVGIFTCGMVGWRLSLWFAARKLAGETHERQAKRAAEVAERDRQLAVMRAAAETSE